MIALPVTGSFILGSSSNCCKIFSTVFVLAPPLTTVWNISSVVPAVVVKPCCKILFI